MKIFITKILSFFLILFVINYCIYLKSRYSWGNKIIDQKIEYVSSLNDKPYKSFFWGSSKTYRHINPIIFDSIAHTTSFNMGYAGCYWFETSYLMDNFIEAYDTSNISNIFLQQIYPTPISKRNLHSRQVKYFMDNKRLSMAYDFYLPRKKYKQLYYHLLMYVENHLNIGLLKGRLISIFKDREMLSNKIIKQKGFYTLEEEVKETKSAYLRGRANKFKVNQKIKVIPKNKNPLLRKINNKYITKIGINFIHIIPGQMGTEMYFDTGHYNDKGAAAFSLEIAQIFNKKNIK